MINEEVLYMLDTETGGLKSYVHGLCSITIKKYNSSFIRNIFFYPQKKIYEVTALNINHHNMDQLYSSGVSREELIKTINSLAIATGKQQNYLIFCGWNIGFDLDFITQIYKEKNAKLPCPIVAFDLLDIAKANIKKKDARKKEDDGVENYKLVTIYQHYFNDFNEEKSHTAKYDTLMVEKLYIKFKELRWI